jgi:predicted ATPase/DNA-binding SARP family transcriptional activator
MTVTSDDPRSTGATVQVRLLGPVELIRDGAIVSLRRGRQQLLVATLALEAGRALAADRLIEALWPEEQPDDPANALQQLVAQVRRALGAERDLLRTTARGYLLELPRAAVDALAFEDDLAAARAALATGDAAHAVALAEAALGRWRGEPLGDAVSGPLRAEAARLSGARIGAELVRADALLALGQVQELPDRLAALTAREPLSEPLWARRLAALAAAGRPAEALEAYEQARRTLAEELGAEPSSELRDLHVRILRGEIATAAPAGRATPFRIPAATTSFVGREPELAALIERLHGADRLITLVGPGGAGKTRLAIEAGWRARDRFPAGADFVRLDAIDGPEAIVSAVARTIRLVEDPGRPMVDTLSGALQGTRLLVLDTCEHLADGAAALAAELVARCPELVILATSRERLGLAGEVVIPVGPLGLPATDQPPSGPQAPALELFVERARAARPDIRWNDAQTAAATAIVRALDGLPLAIELAAARAATLAPTQLAARIGDRLSVLDDALRDPVEHHRGLRAAVAWSHDRLGERERQVFNRVSVFAGAIDPVAAAAIAEAGDETSVLRLLEGLHEKSLLKPENELDGVPRFRMLRTLRAYGRERLIEEGAEAQIRDAHLRHYAELAADADVGIRGPRQLDSLSRLDDAWEDLVAAIRWSCDGGDVAIGLRLLGALGRYLDWRGHLRDAYTWSTHLLDKAPASGAGVGLARAWRSFVLWELSSTAEALSEAELALEQSRDADDFEGQIVALSALAIAARGSGRFHDAIDHTTQALMVAGHADQRWGVAWSHNARGYALAADGQLDRAEEDAQKGAELFTALGDERGRAWSLTLHALIAARRAEWEEAQLFAERAAELAAALADQRTESVALELLAAVARRGTPGREDELLAAAAQRRQKRGQVAPPYRDVDAIAAAGRPAYDS